MRIFIKKNLQWIGLGLVLALTSPIAIKAETYLSSQQFVDGAFGVNVAKLETLWMTKEVAQQADKILGHAPKQLRLRYWKNGLQTA